MSRGIGRKHTGGRKHAFGGSGRRPVGGPSGARQSVPAGRDFEAFIDNSPAAAFVKDQDGRYVYLNGQWEKALGRDVKECLGKTDQDLWPQRWPTACGRAITVLWRLSSLLR